ncbi:hypothetical protein TWF694_005722 [Orbilia ellipsospora]|uniref:Uncharacterized protein n=1 Tax=Orbilia ellipsospora TaxID=2528407 RepID=A0AAV9WRR0_9PEZI
MTAMMTTRVNVGVVIPNISNKMVRIRDVNIIRDVMNRVAGMTSLEISLMVVRRGGKVATEWMHLYEGDLVYIDYPNSKIPPHLKERAVKEATTKPVFVTPRAKAAIPIRPPKDANNTRKNEKTGDGLLIEFSPGSPVFQSSSGGFLTNETSFLSATSSDLNLKDETIYSDLEAITPTTPASLVQVTFRFWSGQELALTVSSESRISSLVTVVTAKVLKGHHNVRATDLDFLTPDGKDITAFIKLGDMFEGDKGDTVVHVSLREPRKVGVDDITHKMENFMPVELGSSLI